MCNKILRRWKTCICVSILAAAFLCLHVFLTHKDLACYNIQDLGSSDKFTPSRKSIFFHETSCKGRLDGREACAVESAARAHPDWQINVLFTAPINPTFSKQINGTFKELTNVQFRRIDLLKYVEGTPAWTVVSDGRLDRSKWRVSHSSDVLRYTTLYKWGGIYLDLDLIVAKNLEGLSMNWSARESQHSIGAGAMCFSHDSIGRLIAQSSIRELGETFAGNEWGNNGPGVITRVLKGICGTDDVMAMTPDDCLGFNVYSPEYFYPIAWSKGKSYFQATNPEPSPEAYGYHVWNKLTHNVKVENNSLYEKLAKKYCPSIYNTGNL